MERNTMEHNTIDPNTIATLFFICFVIVFNVNKIGEK